MTRQRCKKIRVVDTNVPVVANGKSAQAPIELVTKSIAVILDLMRDGVVVIDDADRILGEYRRNLNLRGEPGVGDGFVRWIHDNCANPDCCLRLAVNCLDETSQEFEEYPVDLNDVDVDINDRKFIAVANAKRPPCPIMQAVDVKW